MLVYLKTTTGKKVVITCHQVWDVDLFLRSQRANVMTSKPKQRTDVDLSSYEDYVQFMGYKNAQPRGDARRTKRSKK